MFWDVNMLLMYVCTINVSMYKMNVCMYKECMYVQWKHTCTMNVCI